MALIFHNSVNTHDTNGVLNDISLMLAWYHESFSYVWESYCD